MQKIIYIVYYNNSSNSSPWRWTSLRILNEKNAFMLLAATALILEMVKVVDTVVASEKLMAIMMIAALKLAIGMTRVEAFASERETVIVIIGASGKVTFAWAKMSARINVQNP